MSDNPTITFFIETTGRVPLLEQGEKPWRYRGWLGWLGWHVQRLHESPDCSFPDRWGYLAQIKLGGTDPGPIPPVYFGHADSTVLRDLGKAVDIVGKYGAVGWGWAAFRLYLDWLAYGLGIVEEYPAIDDDVAEQLYRFVDLGAWLETPYDYLAAYICDARGGGWNPNAFYPTPHPVCQMMAEIAAYDLAQEHEDLRWTSVCDPCVGTGRMLLHMSNYSLHLFGQDIDAMMVRCTMINGALYAPWIVAPLDTHRDAVAVLPPPPGE